MCGIWCSDYHAFSLCIRIKFKIAKYKHVILIVNVHCVGCVMRKIQYVARASNLLSSVAEGVGARSGGYVNEGIAVPAILNKALVVSCIFRFYNLENIFYVTSAFRNINGIHFFLSMSVCIKLYN